MPLKTFELLIQWLINNTNLRATDGPTGSTSIEEKVYMFLSICGHNSPNAVIQDEFSVQDGQ